MFFFKNSNIRELEKKCTKDEWAVVIVRNINSLLIQYLSIDFKMKQKKNYHTKTARFFFLENVVVVEILYLNSIHLLTHLIYYILINFTVTLPLQMFHDDYSFFFLFLFLFIHTTTTTTCQCNLSVDRLKTKGKKIKFNERKKRRKIIQTKTSTTTTTATLMAKDNNISIKEIMMI